jgi:uncharacterized protein (TIGR03083 family)
LGEIGNAYHGVRLRVNDLLLDTGDDVGNTIAPATPEWTVRDLLAHLAGVTADIVQGNLDGVGTDEWAAQQVTARRDRNIEQLLAEWNEHGPVIESMADEFGPAAGRLMSDAVAHEHDIRGALGVAGARDSDAVTLSFRFVGESLGVELEHGAAGALEVQHGDQRTTFGRGAPIATLRTTPFEFVRAVTGRRSLRQIAAYDWDGPLDPERLVLRRFVVRPTDLVE